MFSALSARLTAVASRARALSIGSSSPVSSAKSKNARARQIVVLRIVDKTSSQPLSRFQVMLEIGTEFGDELRAPHSQLARSEARRVGNECVSQCKSRWSPTHNKQKNNKK